MSWPSDRRVPGLLFAALVVAEMVHTGVAIWQHRVPSGHDGFQYFTLQYYFLDNAIQSHDVAQWMPYMNQGTVATLWYGIQGSFLQNVLLYASPLVRHADLLSVFHAGMFVDEMILLTGTWLLARRFLRTPAAFFVAVSVVGSCVWLDQPYWNFRLYYAIPLVLELGHRFLDTGRWRWFALCANLLALQTVGNLPYFIPVASFVVCGYFVSYAAANPDVVWPQVRALRWRIPAVVAASVAAVSFAVAYSYLGIGIDQLMNYNPGRLQNGTTDLLGFLRYGGLTDADKWIDVALNLSPWYDITLYAGILLAPLLLCGLCVVDRRRAHLAVLSIVMLLFTLGTFVSVMLFLGWPAMKYLRHIGLVSPLVKVLFCFVAGVGFEWLFDPPSPHPAWRLRASAAACALLLLVTAVAAVGISRAARGGGNYVDRVWNPGLDRPIHDYDAPSVAARLRWTAVLAVTGAAMVGIVPIWLAARRRPARARRMVLLAVLVFVAGDLYHFKFDYLAGHSDVVPPEARSVTRADPLVYPARRERNLDGVAVTNPRVQAMAAFNQPLKEQLRHHYIVGAKYWTNGAFLFIDEAGSSFRVDSWLKPLDQLMRMYWRDPIDDTSIGPRGLGFEHFDFPLDHAAAAAVAGVSADKIRFFARAVIVPSADALAPLMIDPSFGGNVLFLLPPAGPDNQAAETFGADRAPWTPARALSGNDARDWPHEVVRFDANHLVVRVTNPSAAGAWLSYADVWHPFWRATVNGRPVPVYRAEMAYKAVPIAAGENVVQFEFGSARLRWLSVAFALNAACWLIAVAWLMWRVVEPAT